MSTDYPYGDSELTIRNLLRRIFEQQSKKPKTFNLLSSLSILNPINQIFFIHHPEEPPASPIRRPGSTGEHDFPRLKALDEKGTVRGYTYLVTIPKDHSTAVYMTYPANLHLHNLIGPSPSGLSACSILKAET